LYSPSPTPEMKKTESKSTSRTGERLKIIGTSHIAKESVSSIKREIENWKPNIVALELDSKRFYGLMHQQKGAPKARPSIRKVGLKGYLFTIIGAWVQQKLGERVGIMPGSDMKSAAEAAAKNQIPIALIDQDIEETLRNFSKSFSFREKFNIFADMFLGIFFRREIVKFDISRVPDKSTIDMVITKIKKRYPNIYKVFIGDRNKFMARNLISIMRSNPEKKILAVVGAGHEDEILNLIKKHSEGTVDVVKNNISYNFTYSV